MPLEQSHVRLHLSVPSNLREIRLAGPNLATAQIHLTQANPEDGIDYGAVTAEPQTERDAAGMGASRRDRPARQHRARGRRVRR